MKNQNQCLDDVHAILESHLPTDRPSRILEAGGGSFSHIHVDRATHISVIDISPEQLERNDYADEIILGDLEDPNAISGRHDLIVCFDVLEHLKRPKLALKHMMAALNPGGLLVIGCPNRSSTKGMITRFTPHAFHVWYYRNVRGIKDAGQTGHAPFETFLKSEMDFETVQDQLSGHGLTIKFAQIYEGPAPRELKAKHPLLYRLYTLPSILAPILGGKRDNLAGTDWIIVAQRAPLAKAQALPLAQSA